MRSTEEKIKRKVISVVIIVAILSTMAGCGKSQSRKEPITLTIWHVYGGQTDSPLNDLIDEFNGTEGKKEGIKIQVGMVSNTNTIHEEVLKAANKDPGADVASAAYVWMRNSKFRFRDIENQLGDIVLMRVAEIYLINAEAKAHLNDPDAINKLNDLKTARGAKTIHTNLSQQDTVLPFHSITIIPLLPDL